MELNKFILDFSDQFEETDSSEFNEHTIFHELEEWSSLTGAFIIVMIKNEYGYSISGEELQRCVTIKDLFDVVANNTGNVHC